MYFKAKRLKLIKRIMDIIGKFGIWMVWKCEKGFHHKGWLASSSSVCCEHCDGTTYFDGLDTSKLIEITNEIIIKELINE